MLCFPAIASVSCCLLPFAHYTYEWLQRTAVLFSGRPIRGIHWCPNHSGGCTTANWALQPSHTGSNLGNDYTKGLPLRFTA